MRKNRKCICCSTEYSYCPNCGGPDKLKPSWYSEFCSEDCKDLWMTATKFNMGMVEKKDAKEIISALSLKDKSEYAKCVQTDLDNIFKDEEKVPTKAKKSKSHEVVIKKENK